MADWHPVAWKLWNQCMIFYDKNVSDPPLQRHACCLVAGPLWLMHTVHTFLLSCVDCKGCIVRCKTLVHSGQSLATFTGLSVAGCCDRLSFEPSHWMLRSSAMSPYKRRIPSGLADCSYLSWRGAVMRPSSEYLASLNHLLYVTCLKDMCSQFKEE